MGSIMAVQYLYSILMFTALSAENRLKSVHLAECKVAKIHCAAHTRYSVKRNSYSCKLCLSHLLEFYSQSPIAADSAADRIGN